MPRVTILMPTYNVAPYIEEAIASVLRQTYRDFELLVLDDCSTDDTWNLVCRISDPRIHPIRHRQNLGLAENLNWGLDHIDTELVARMDGDDIAEPDWLEQEVAWLDRHPEVGICGAGFTLFGSKHYDVIFPSKPEEVAANMLFECCVTVPTFRLDLIHRHNLRYRSDAFPAEDYRFWVDCLPYTRICNIPRILFRYRRHERQISTVLQERQRQQSDAVRRIMLHRLNDRISEADSDYFLRYYAPGVLSGRADYRQMRQFGRKLLKMNHASGHFSQKALRHRCHRQEVQALYRHITEHHFRNGYSLAAYLRYLTSGCAGHTTLRYELKFLLKSILHRAL